MFLIRRIFASLSLLLGSVLAAFVAQWLEKFFGGWLANHWNWSPPVKLADSVWNFFWGLIVNIYGLTITGAIFLDFIIKSILIFFIFIFGALASGLTSELTKEIKIPLPPWLFWTILLLLFGIPLIPPLVPYVFYIVCFGLLGLSLRYCNYLLGSKASICLFLPLLVFICLMSNIFSYINLENSVYKDWIAQDKVVILNFADFCLYTLRASLLGFRGYEPFLQYWILLPINLTISAIFLVAATINTISLGNLTPEGIGENLKKNNHEISSQRSNPVALFLAVLFTMFVLFNGFKWAFEDSKFILANSINSQKSTLAVTTQNNTKTTLFITISMDSSTSMVGLIANLKEGYKQQNPNIQINYGLDRNGKPSANVNVQPTGSLRGLKNLIEGTVTMAASSRPLTPDEARAGITLTPIARDAIAVVVGANNPFKGGLTASQLSKIYQGQITKWSEVGGSDKLIKVYNHGEESGTREFFRENILLGNPFPSDRKNFKTWERDETTAVLQVLGDDGIYYATVSQATGQDTIRVVPIDGINPLNKETIKKKIYPINRDLYLATLAKLSPEAKQFIEFVRSPKGQEIVEKSGFISIL